MRIKSTRLKKLIEGYDKVVLYGAGNIAQLAVKTFDQFGIVPEFCVVSHLEKARSVLENIPVWQLEECEEVLNKSDVIIVIAVSELYQKEIENILIRRGILNYVFFSDCFCKNTKAYKNMSRQEYMAEIAEWYVDEHKLSLGDIIPVTGQLQKIIERRSNENKILLLVGNLSPRVIKIAGALQERGIIVESLVYINDGIKDIFIKRLKECSSTYISCERLEELMYRLICSDAKIAHVFSCMWISDVMRVLLNRKELFPQIVFEQYDIANGMYPFVRKDILDEERYCLENTDGLCCRGYEQDFLVEKAGYELTSNKIEFFDYCNDDAIEDKMTDNSASLSLCYAGGLPTEDEWPGASYLCLMDYIELCERNECHLHVYPAMWDECLYTKYIALAKESRYFHLHKPIPYEDLTKELSQYDYGIGILFKRSLAGKKIDGYYTKEKFVYAASNHFYDYVSAGLPVISAVPVKLCQIFKENGVLLEWALEDFDFEELKNRRTEMREKVKNIREELRISNHINKLIEFYDSLLK